jgi:hypothetical protein
MTTLAPSFCAERIFTENEQPPLFTRMKKGLFSCLLLIGKSNQEKSWHPSALVSGISIWAFKVVSFILLPKLCNFDWIME